MSSMLRALVISPDVDALLHIQAAFRTTPDVELSMHTDWPVLAQHSAHTIPNILILHSDAPSERLRQLRRQGYQQPALVLTNAEPLEATPLEEDLTPLENVTWAVVRAGGLPHCVSMLLTN